MLGFAPVRVRVSDRQVPCAATCARGAVGSDLGSTMQSIVMRITHGWGPASPGCTRTHPRMRHRCEKAARSGGNLRSAPDHNPGLRKPTAC